MGNSVKDYFRLLAEDKDNGAAAKAFYPMLDYLSRVYGKASRAYQDFYNKNRAKKEKLPFPVISVGNITWGGSGKTPLVEYIARRVSEMNKNPLILSRGYSHDEIEQYKEHLPNILIGIGKNRAKTARELSRTNRVDTAILDDGFQHWKLERDLEILMINALNPFGNGKLIPRGSLREPVEAISRAHIIVLNHSNLVKPDMLRGIKKKITDLAPRALLVESYLEPLFFFRAKKRQRVPLEKLAEKRVTTFSAVGVPRSFQIMLSNMKVKPIRNFEFSDHHMFSKNDLREIKTMRESSGSEDIVTTEKDFYRTPKEIMDMLDPLVLAARMRISTGEKAFMDKVARVAGGYK